MSDHSPIMAPARRPVLTETIERLAVCGCGVTLPPDGRCLEIGQCADADTAATRGAARVTAKYAVPAAWTARGSVD